MKTVVVQLVAWILLWFPLALCGQNEDRTLLSGSLLTDERFLTDEDQQWAWNEQRITLLLKHKLTGTSKFHSEIWLRNLGLPALTQSGHLYQKGMVDPVSAEIREAYVQLNGFLIKNMDLTIGRQRLVWGTADQLNPTDNLNPADLEDILDFGRRRGSDAINLMFYPARDLSLQAVYIPRFAPASLPIGIFAKTLTPAFTLPPGLVLCQQTDTLLMPSYNLADGATVGFRAKGLIAGIDLSASYLWGRDGLPMITGATLSPLDTVGGIAVHAQLSWPRFHIFGVDAATSVAGIGLWAEAALHLPDKEVVMQTDLSPLFPWSPVPVILDSVLIQKDQPFLKYIVGGDYHFSDGSYLNLQFQHGFIHEKGQEQLNDYLFVRYEKSIFQDKLNLSPLTGALVVTDWKEINNGYALVYMPEMTYKATANTELVLSAAFFKGKGESLFASLSEYNMVVFKLKYSLQ